MMKTVPVLASVLLGIATTVQADSGLPRQADIMILTQHQMDTVAASGIGLYVEAAALGEGQFTASLTSTYTDTTADEDSSSGYGWGVGFAYGDADTDAEVSAGGYSTETYSWIGSGDASVTAGDVTLSFGAVNGFGVSP